MTPGFTPDERAALAKYVRFVADRMQLRDWTLEMMFDPPPNANCIAMIRPVYGRKIANVWFERGFAQRDAEQQRHTVVHELTHLVLDPITATIENIGEKLIGATAFTVLWETMKERAELATDQMAEILVHGMPLIEWDNTGPVERVTWTDTATDPADPDPPE